MALLSPKTVNPLNVLACRELAFPGKHLIYTYIPMKQEKAIREWINTELKHRYYIGEALDLENNQITIKLKVGFEDHKELSYFLLACPII